MERTPSQPDPAAGRIPPTLRHPAAGRFWTAVVLTAVATGAGAIAFTVLLEFVQRLVWGGSGHDLLDAVQRVSGSRRFLILASAGLVTGAGQFLLRRLTSANGIDTTTAIWFEAGRMPALRTLGSATLSVAIVGMGVSLGREGAPKQAGAVFANLFSDRLGLSDEQRRLLVASAAGGGMAGAYGVPLGGALFSLEVLRGVLGLRYVLPALFVSVLATAVAWLGLPNAPTYAIPSFGYGNGAAAGAAIVGLVTGFASVGYVRLIGWADRNKPTGRWRMAAPAIGLALVGGMATVYPQVLGNGRDVSQLAFAGQLGLGLAATLFLLKPAAIALCVRCGAPGGLFTPTLTVGAMLGAVLGYAGNAVWPGAPVGLWALLGAAAMEAAVTQGPVSTAVLVMELTGRDRSVLLPMLVAIGCATLVARTIELRSVYEARLSDEQVEQRRALREQS